MQIQIRSKIDFSLTFSINEAEAKALDALSGYDFEAFMEVFKTHLGKHYMEGHETALKSVFAQFRRDIPSTLNRLETARKVFHE